MLDLLDSPVLLVWMLAPSLHPSPRPVSAGILSWLAESIPDATGNLVAAGTDVSDFVVASDNATIYAADKEADKLYKSTNAGVGWTELTNPIGAIEPQLVAVAPDDANIVAIVADDNEVYATDNGGISWGSLGTVQEGAEAAATELYDITISTERAGIHYVAVAGIEAGPLANVWYYDLGAMSPAWKETNDLIGFSTTSTTTFGSSDRAVAVAFSPNFSLDWVMVAVTAEWDGAGATDNVSFQMLAVSATAMPSYWNQAVGFSNYPVTIASDDGITGPFWMPPNTKSII